MTSKPKSSDAGRNRLPARHATAVLILASSLLLLALLSHHPTTNADSTESFIHQMQSIRPVNQFVHGSAIVLVSTLYCGLSCFASHLGNGLIRVRLGTLTYGIGVGAFIVAAMMSGFVVPRIAAFYGQETQQTDTAGSHEHDFSNTFGGHGSKPVDRSGTGDKPIISREDLVQAQGAFVVCSRINREFDQLGVAAVSLGIFLWSTVLLQRHGRPRFVGAVGCLIGTLSTIGLFTGHTGASVSGVILFSLILVVWNVAVSWLLLSRDTQLSPETTSFA